MALGRELVRAARGIFGRVLAQYVEAGETLLPPRLTTVERDALTAVEGMLVFNETTSTPQMYIDGAWVDLSAYLGPPVTVTSSPYTVGAESVILVDDDTVGGAVTVNLPAASTWEDQVKHIKKLGTTGTVTVDGNASETIDGATTQALAAQYDAIRIYSDGTDIHIL